LVNNSAQRVKLNQKKKLTQRREERKAQTRPDGLNGVERYKQVILKAPPLIPLGFLNA
jgi:hypothetical protein